MHRFAANQPIDYAALVREGGEGIPITDAMIADASARLLGRPVSASPDDEAPYRPEESWAEADVDAEDGIDVPDYA